MEKSELKREEPINEMEFSGREIKDLPFVLEPEKIVQINLSNNVFTIFPDLNQFSSLRILDVSHNKIEDLSGVSYLPTLAVLNCSFNEITSLGFVCNFRNLQILNASNNRISSINDHLPDSLVDIDLSWNQFINLDFLQRSLPTGLQKFSINGIPTSNLIDLRFFAVFSKLKVLNTGFFDSYHHKNLLPFVKYLCPSLIYFDGIECSFVKNDLNQDQIFDALLKGDENQLRFLLDQDIDEMIWDEPEFYDYEDKMSNYPLSKIMNKLNDLENQLPSNPTNQMIDVESKKAFVKKAHYELSQIKKQLIEISSIVYAHDEALQQMF